MADNQENAISRIEQAVAEGGAYEIIYKRLKKQGEQLAEHTRQLNKARQNEFGSTEMQVLNRLRIRTENNCEARDLVLVGEYVLFGYNAFLGLRKETKLEDVFSVYRLNQQDDNLDLEPVNIQKTFLNDQSFIGDFKELYAYYKDTCLSQLVVKDGKLLAAFKIGEKLSDLRVFRWSISPDLSKVEYIDNRGERDIELPASHDFEWVESHRDDVVAGRHPHINILDSIFIDTLNSYLTIKLENNTDTGQGIYSEPVDDATQSLDDAEFYFSEVGSLILLKIKPYREQEWRYLVFNRNTQQVTRIDAIGDSCVRLPEDHGLMYPGGYYLTTGEVKAFDHNYQQLKYKRTIKSPNGEDVLFVFYQPQSNVIGLYAYNLISKSLQNPLFGHGYGFYPDGKLIIFYAQEEATRVHPVQIWQTPFFSDDYASNQTASQSFFGKIGNSDLVRGISELFSIAKLVTSSDVSSAHFDDLGKRSLKIFDNFHWLSDAQLDAVKNCLKQIHETSQLVIDEYEKVTSIQKQSSKALRAAQTHQAEIVRDVESENWHKISDFMQAIGRLRQQRGQLISLKELRYIDTDKIEQLLEQVDSTEDNLNKRTVEFLSSDEALKSYFDDLDAIQRELSTKQSVAELKPLLVAMEDMSTSLDLLSELMATLKVSDATLQTRIVESVSEVYSLLNQTKAKLNKQQKNFGAEEAAAQFAAQFKLLSQSAENALSLADTPERCDEQLTRLLSQLEELESSFGDYEEFLDAVLTKRDNIFETFEAHKLALLEKQQRKAQSLFDAGSRIINSVKRRAQKISDQDKLNSFFSSDSLITKAKQIVTQLFELEDSIKAEQLSSLLKSTQEDAIRGLRDKSDIYEGDGKIIKLGPKHKFSVNTQTLDVTLLPKNDHLYVHLVGTNFYEQISHSELEDLKAFWNMSTYSESENVYRAEFLAFQILNDCINNNHGYSWEMLHAATVDESKLLKLIKEYISPKYQEGYSKGVHDHDAAKILVPLVNSFSSAGVLRYLPQARALAVIYWSNFQSEEQQALWPQRAQSAKQMKEIFPKNTGFENLTREVFAALKSMAQEYDFNLDDTIIGSASEYLIAELASQPVQFSVSKYGISLFNDFKLHLETHSAWNDFSRTLKCLEKQIGKRWDFSKQWVESYLLESNKSDLAHFVPEVVMLLNANSLIATSVCQVDLSFKVDELLGEHSRINNQTLDITLDDFLHRLTYHCNLIVPKFQRYLELKQKVTQEQRKTLRVHDFIPKPLTSFVRNRLINEAYLPVIGDNLAKQIGTLGDKKRTDLMGLLMMISPPGYGKTTLMEYVASRLGLVFMKINCPSIGHEVTSIDPAQATNSATRQELEKLNLSLEMGNNVMLYLDDIQHTNPEFLQKFISLCDGTRRIEGVWKGEAKTYDMRGKKFCVVMAGNPYTESGELFKIPDMLANRADIYNLGDMLSGQEEIFNMSYIENSLTSNPVLSPLATRDMSDVYQLISMAKGGDGALTDLKHQYSAAEVNEMLSVLKRMFQIQSVVSKINQQYIRSSAQAEKYRDEPAFKLQGSYRNMNKMAEKLSAVMTDAEVEALIDDHYQGESQLLTTGAEENLLKLKSLRNTLTQEESARWSIILEEFKRAQSMGGEDAQVGEKIALQLHDLVKQVSQVSKSLDLNGHRESANTDKENESLLIIEIINEFKQLTEKLLHSQPKIEVVNKPMPETERILASIADTFEGSIKPLIKVMDGKLNLDLKTHEKMVDIEAKLSLINEQYKAK
ncbi:DNA repair ATPase [Aliikangiella sp. IMCC44653]